MHQPELILKKHWGFQSFRPFQKEIIFNFPRQNEGDRLCISDLCDPSPEVGDNIAMFVVTVGDGIREEAGRRTSAAAEGTRRETLGGGF